MQIPSVMFIEMAMDSLKNLDQAIATGEIKQFSSLGPARMAAILSTVADKLEKSELQDITTGSNLQTYSIMLSGYLLGLETARVLLATMPVAVQANVTI